MSTKNDDDFQRLCVNLIVLSKLRSEDRLETTGKFKVHRSGRGWIPVAFSRWWNNDSRQETLSAIKTLYTSIRDILVHLDKAQTERMIKLVKRSRHGLYRLRETYENDETTVAEIDSMLYFTESSITGESASKSADTADSAASQETF